MEAAEVKRLWRTSRQFDGRTDAKDMADREAQEATSWRALRDW